MQTHLFHVDVYMPKAFYRPVFEGRLKYSEHAKRAAQDDRYGNIPLPACFDSQIAQLIEAEFDMERNRVIKQVWRQRLDETRDLVLVITRDGTVKTVWINLRSDPHKTLDKARYVRR